MILEIPFTYRATVVLPRHRNEQMVGVRATLPVRIDEVTGEQAPLAAIRRSAPNRNGEVLTTSYRAHGGGLVHTPTFTLAGPDGKRVSRGMRGDEVQAYLNAVFQGSGGGMFTPTQKTVETTINGRRDARTWISDNRERIEQAIMANVRRAVLIDGVLHKKTSGPFWAIEVNRHDERPVELYAGDHMGKDDSYYWLRYRGDRYAEALEAARAELDRLGKPELAVVEQGAIEVLIPEAFTYDEDWAYLKHAIDEFLSLNGPQIHRWPADAVHAYVALRDQAALWPEARTAEAMSAVIEARRTVEGRGLKLGKRCHEPEVPYRFDRMNLMIDRLANSGGVPAPAATAALDVTPVSGAPR